MKFLLALVFGIFVAFFAEPEAIVYAEDPPPNTVVAPENKDATTTNDEDEHGIDIQSSDTTPETPEKSEVAAQEKIFSLITDNPIITALVVVIVILSAVIIFLLCRNRKTPPDVPKIISPPNVELRFRVGNFHHIGCREEQQDSFCLSNVDDKKALREKGLMAIVADGMGGMEGGAAISQLVADTFRKNYATATEFEPADFLYNTAKKSEELVDAYKKRAGLNGGSTLVAVLIKSGAFYTLSVGDSKIYLLRQGKLEQLNHEHTFGALLREKAARGEVPPDEPYINPRRDALTAYIGMGSFRKVDCGEARAFLAGDKILLCSDGVSNSLSDDEIISALKNDALTAAEKMEQIILAQEIPTQDNFTGIILECVT